MGIKVDAALPILIGSGRSVRSAHVLLVRATRSHAGRRALWAAAGTDGPRPEPIDPIEKRLVQTVRVTGGVWRDDAIDLDQSLPEVVVQAMPGRPADELMRHPACHGRVVAKVEATPTSTTIRMETKDIDLSRLLWRRPDWRIAAAMAALADRTADARIRERVRWMCISGSGPVLPNGVTVLARRPYDTLLTATLILTGLLAMLSVGMIGLATLGHRPTNATAIALMAAAFVVSATLGWWFGHEVLIEDEVMLAPPW